MSLTKLKRKFKGCETGYDFKKIAEKNPDVKIIEGKRHIKVGIPGKGGTTLPRHKKQLAKGTWLSIAKAYVRLGIAIFIAMTIFYTTVVQ